MGKWIIGIVCLAGGLAVGASIAYLRDANPGLDYGNLFEVARYAMGEKQFRPADDATARLEVDNGREFDFGSMDVGEKLKHTFTIRNMGTVPLAIKLVRTTCKCAVGELTSDLIQPGDSGDVTLEWRALEYQTEYRQSATIQSNDPSNEIVNLSVIGRVVEAVRALPQSLILGDATSSDSRTASLTVYAFRDPTMEIERFEWVASELSDQFDVTWQTSSSETVAEMPGAKSACDLTVQLKPGIPYGSFHETLRLYLTSAPGTLEVPVRGRIVSDIAVAGAGYSERQGVAELGLVKQDEGATLPLLVLVKGPHRNEVTLQKLKTDPAEDLDVEIGEPTVYPTVVKFPIKVIVPKHAPLVQRRASTDNAGRILLKTTHPTIGEINFLVSFAVVE